MPRTGREGLTAAETARLDKLTARGDAVAGHKLEDVFAPPTPEKLKAMRADLQLELKAEVPVKGLCWTRP